MAESIAGIREVMYGISDDERQVAATLGDLSYHAARGQGAIISAISDLQTATVHANEAAALAADNPVASARHQAIAEEAETYAVKKLHAAKSNITDIIAGLVLAESGLIGCWDAAQSVAPVGHKSRAAIITEQVAHQEAPLEETKGRAQAVDQVLPDSRDTTLLYEAAGHMGAIQEETEYQSAVAAMVANEADEYMACL